ncbi:MAG: cysteine protease StiP domain-containing protein [Sphingomonadaceae bacterium]
MAGFSGSYDAADVTFLLKPIALAPTDTETKERLIQSGARHYSEMLSVETPPDDVYMALYHSALERNGARLGRDIASLAAAIGSAVPGEIVIVSLVRAGTPIGILLTRALMRAGRAATHYSVSIIRDRGIDRQALAYIAARHDPASIIFVDGWTGKGAIARELRASLASEPHGIKPCLAVIADPAGVADFAATHDDYLIASGLLNSIVSGLVSRSILNADHVGEGDFHACVYYDQFAPLDQSRAFVDTVDGLAMAAEPQPLAGEGAAVQAACRALVIDIMAASGVHDRNRIKPGIAEATRAVVRRVPHSLWLHDAADPDVEHLCHLSRTKGIAILPLPAGNHFRAVAVIKSLGSE